MVCHLDVPTHVLSFHDLLYLEVREQHKVRQRRKKNKTKQSFIAK